MKHPVFSVDVFLEAGPYVGVHLLGRVRQLRDAGDPASTVLEVTCDRKTPATLVQGEMACEIQTGAGPKFRGIAAPLGAPDGAILVSCARRDLERALAA